MCAAPATVREREGSFVPVTEPRVVPEAAVSRPLGFIPFVSGQEGLLPSQPSGRTATLQGPVRTVPLPAPQHGPADIRLSACLPGSIIYNRTDLDGHCYYATCSLDCHVVRTHYTCASGTTPPVPTTSPAGSSPSASAPVTAQGCPNAVPPRRVTPPSPPTAQAGAGTLSVSAARLSGKVRGLGPKQAGGEVAGSGHCRGRVPARQPGARGLGWRLGWLRTTGHPSGWSRPWGAPGSQGGREGSGGAPGVEATCEERGGGGPPPPPGEPPSPARPPPAAPLSGEPGATNLGSFLHRKARPGPCPTALRPPARATASSPCSRGRARRCSGRRAPTATRP